MKLFDYQQDGLDWLVSREKLQYQEIDGARGIRGGILADEVGLGKTIMSIRLIAQNPKPNTLIIAPKSLLSQWINEFAKFAPHINCSIGSGDSYPLNTDADNINVVLISQSRLNSRGVFPGSLKICSDFWDRVIIDEAHSIKNNKSKIHKACCALRSEIRWALTATPIMNKMTDFVYILGWVGIPQEICQNHKQLVSDTFIMRRTKEDICANNDHLKLPACNVTINRLPFGSDEEFNLYTKVHSDMYERIKLMQEHDAKNTIQALELLLRIRQVCTHPQAYVDGIAKQQSKGKRVRGETWQHGSTKLKAIVESVKSQPPKEKSLIFCHFIIEMNAYCDAFEDGGYKVARLDGSMSIDERASNVDMFNSDPDCTIFVIQLHTGGVGYNLQCANWVHITSPTWNPSLQHQIIGRAHRSGQKREVNVAVYVISKGDDTYVEDYIIDLQRSKLKMISEILNDPRIAPGDIEGRTQSLTFADVAGLFERKIEKVV